MGQPVDPGIRIDPAGTISVRIENLPLDLVLRLMSDRKLFDIRGARPGSEKISAAFSGLTLGGAMKKLMRGYNYAILDEAAGRPLLMVFGRTVRPSPATQRVFLGYPKPPGDRAPDTAAHRAGPTFGPRQQTANGIHPNLPGYLPAKPGPGFVQPIRQAGNLPQAPGTGNAGTVTASSAAPHPGGPPQQSKQGTEGRAAQDSGKEAQAVEPEKTGVKF
jgi:hypothetical protein